MMIKSVWGSSSYHHKFILSNYHLYRCTVFVQLSIFLDFISLGTSFQATLPTAPPTTTTTTQLCKHSQQRRRIDEGEI